MDLPRFATELNLLGKLLASVRPPALDSRKQIQVQVPTLISPAKTMVSRPTSCASTTG